VLSTELGLGGRVSPHGIRRAVVDRLYRAGVAPEVEASLLGHSPGTALQHYRRVSESERTAAVQAAFGPTKEER
jgi:site-specific recombinase XerD